MKMTEKKWKQYRKWLVEKLQSFDYHYPHTNPYAKMSLEKSLKLWKEQR